MVFDLVYSKEKKKNCGGVTVVVLALTGFLSIILTLFLGSAIDDLKYRQQMRSGTELRVEAYSFLDLALSFLGEYKKKGEVETFDGNSKVEKAKNKLIFDAEILGGQNDEDIAGLISRYIAERIGGKMQQVSVLQTTEGTADKETGPKRRSATLKHGNYMIDYEFEDISAKIPLCKEFDQTSESRPYGGLISIIANKAPNNGVKKLMDHITKGGALSKWGSVEAVIRDTGFSSSSSETVDLNELKEIFTIEPCALKAAGYNDSPNAAGSRKPGKFKINLLTAHKTILEALDGAREKAHKLVDRSNRNTYNFNDDLEDLKKYCSVEVSIFSLTVKVSTQSGNSFALRCICDDTDAAPGNGTPGRSPFRIAKIEEF
jgi:hypothetical protein